MGVPPGVLRFVFFAFGSAPFKFTLGMAGFVSFVPPFLVALEHPVSVPFGFTFFVPFHVRRVSRFGEGAFKDGTDFGGLKGKPVV